MVYNKVKLYAWNPCHISQHIYPSARAVKKVFGKPSAPLRFNVRQVIRSYSETTYAKVHQQVEPNPVGVQLAGWGAQGALWYSTLSANIIKDASKAADSSLACRWFKTHKKTEWEGKGGAGSRKGNPKLRQSCCPLSQTETRSSSCTSFVSICR